MFHVNALWGTVAPGSTPYDPPPILLEMFARMYSNDSSLFSNTSTQPQLAPTSVILRAWSDTDSHGCNITRLRRFEETHVGLIKATLARHGLRAFAPDLCQSPYSLYNNVHRIVATDTFRQLLLARAYEPFDANPKYASEVEFLVKLYDHHMHHYWQGRYEQEIKNPGTLKAIEEENATIQNR